MKWFNTLVILLTDAIWIKYLQLVILLVYIITSNGCNRSRKHIRCHNLNKNISPSHSHLHECQILFRSVLARGSLLTISFLVSASPLIHRAVSVRRHVARLTRYARRTYAAIIMMRKLAHQLRLLLYVQKSIFIHPNLPLYALQ